MKWFSPFTSITEEISKAEWATETSFTVSFLAKIGPIQLLKKTFACSRFALTLSLSLEMTTSHFRLTPSAITRTSNQHLTFHSKCYIFLDSKWHRNISLDTLNGVLTQWLLYLNLCAFSKWKGLVVLIDDAGTYNCLTLICCLHSIQHTTGWENYVFGWN